MLTVWQIRYLFRTQGEVRFPALAGNTLRGALGDWSRENDTTLFRECFKPGGSDRSSVRPFVIRANHLGSLLCPSGERFSFSVHLFLSDELFQARLTTAIASIFQNGVGLGRGRAELEEVQRTMRIIELAGSKRAQSVQVAFASPTELKSNNALAERFEFDVLFRRIRGRLRTLETAYSERFETDLREQLLTQAKSVEIVKSNLTHVDLRRHSTRTGQVHPAGGMTGSITYAGPLSDFVPYLHAAELIGVGRQTTWGNGEIVITILG